MTEWWTYGLSDFLMFSPQAYWRLVARHNEAGWPVQVLGQAAVLALPLLMARDAAAMRRVALLLLALAWAAVGWFFHAKLYAEIFLGAPWVAAACGVQALLLLLAALAPWHGTTSAAVRAFGLALLAVAALYPLLAPMTGHATREAEVFGWMPDPTALATIGALCVMPMHAGTRTVLCTLPALSLALGMATRWLLA
ncbi:DUF6064 family protein [Ramlibacter sp. PS3R-8]|uniref:DUF6064 family protein n=1 Tax=Ramlibacter sp. PS3R-8 TaxID=3133437 RepID=UPI0030AEFBAD